MASLSPRLARTGGLALTHRGSCRQLSAVDIEVAVVSGTHMFRPLRGTADTLLRPMFHSQDDCVARYPSCSLRARLPGRRVLGRKRPDNNQAVNLFEDLSLKRRTGMVDLKS